jgi:hypothetical protein
MLNKFNDTFIIVRDYRRNGHRESVNFERHRRARQGILDRSIKLFWIESIGAHDAEVVTPVTCPFPIRLEESLVYYTIDLNVDERAVSFVIEALQHAYLPEWTQWRFACIWGPDRLNQAPVGAGLWRQRAAVAAIFRSGVWSWRYNVW